MRLLDPANFKVKDENGNITDLPLEDRLERVNNLLKTTGSEQELIRHASMGDTSFQKVWDIGSLYFNKLTDADMPTFDVLANITSGSIGLVVGNKSSIRLNGQSVGSSIHNRYHNLVESESIDAGLTLNTVELFRKEIVESNSSSRKFEINGSVASAIWDNVVFSYHDFVSGTKLPMSLGYKEIYYLGMVRVAGSSHQKSDRPNNTQRYETIVTSRSLDYELMKEIFIPFTLDLFNKKTNFKSDNFWEVSISSVAIRTWIASLLGRFKPEDKDEVYGELDITKADNLSKPETESWDEFYKNAKHVYLAGQLARKGNLSKTKPYLLVSASKRPWLIESICETSAQLGYTPSVIDDGRRLRFGSDDISRMAYTKVLDGRLDVEHIGLFTNPFDLRILRDKGY